MGAWLRRDLVVGEGQGEEEEEGKLNFDPQPWEDAEAWPVLLLLWQVGVAPWGRGTPERVGQAEIGSEPPADGDLEPNSGPELREDSPKTEDSASIPVRLRSGTPGARSTEHCRPRQ